MERLLVVSDVRLSAKERRKILKSSAGKKVDFIHIGKRDSGTRIEKYFIKFPEAEILNVA